jgi:hypothetical protein
MLKSLSFRERSCTLPPALHCQSAVAVELYLELDVRPFRQLLSAQQEHRFDETHQTSLKFIFARTRRLLPAVRSFRVLATAIAIRTAEVRNADFSSKFGGLKPRFSVLIQSTARNMLDALRAPTP